MRTLKYWKTVPIFEMVAYDLVPVTTITSDQSFFDRIVAAVKASDCSYIITETHESIVETRQP